MRKIRDFTLGAGLLAILAGAPGCATMADKVTRNADVAGIYVVDECLEEDINTLLNVYRWGFHENVPEMARNIYSQIPEEEHDNFFFVDAIWANALRKMAVEAGEESMYWDSEAMFKKAYTKMDNAFDDSGLTVEQWLEFDGYIDNNRLGKWILLDSWGLLQKDYVVAGLNGGDDPKYNLYSALAYIEMGRQLVEGQEGDWEGVRGVSERHVKEVKNLLDEYVR